MDEDIVGGAASCKRYLGVKNNETTVVTDGRKLTASGERVARTIHGNDGRHGSTAGRGGLGASVAKINLLDTPVRRARKIRRSRGKGDEAPVRSDGRLLRSLI